MKPYSLQQFSKNINPSILLLLVQSLVLQGLVRSFLGQVIMMWLLTSKVRPCSLSTHLPAWNALSKSIGEISRDFFAAGLIVFKPNRNIGLLRLCAGNHYKNGSLLQYPSKITKDDIYQDFHPYMDLHRWKRLPRGDVAITGTLLAFCPNAPGSPCSPFPGELILPTVEIPIHNFTIPVPHYPRAYSRYLYGLNWTVPDKNHNAHGLGS
jgi:hypothetical protein